jgi:hypothetical protein
VAAGAVTVTLGSDSCSVCCAQAPAADAAIAIPAMTPASPGMAGMIYSPAFRKLPTGSYCRTCKELSAYETSSARTAAVSVRQMLACSMWT